MFKLLYIRKKLESHFLFYLIYWKFCFLLLFFTAQLLIYCWFLHWFILCYFAIFIKKNLVLPFLLCFYFLHIQFPTKHKTLYKNPSDNPAQTTITSLWQFLTFILINIFQILHHLDIVYTVTIIVFWYIFLFFNNLRTFEYAVSLSNAVYHELVVVFLLKASRTSSFFLILVSYYL